MGFIHGTVHPRMGVGIETLDHHCHNHIVLVHPRMGVGIETPYGMRHIIIGWRSPPHGGGD
jgi:hypothetical protein